MSYIPFVVDRLDNEAQCWTHTVDILAHDPLNDGRFPGVIKSQHQNPHLLVLEPSLA